METKTEKKSPKVAKEARQCKCFSVQVDTYHEVVNTETGETIDTGVPVFGLCSGTTKREFAPGHDAKLKGVLIKLHAEGAEYHYQDGSMLTSVDPLIVAKERGWEHFLYIQPKDKTTKPVSTAVAHTRVIPSAVKVGRWEYGVTKVVAETQDAMTVEYKTAKGETKTVTVDRSKLVA